MIDDNPYRSPNHQTVDAAVAQPTIWFRRFRRGFLWWGAFPMALTVMLISTDQNPGLFLLLTAAWWLVGLTLVVHSNAGFFTALAMVGGLWLLGCYLTVRRINFAIENHGIEGVGGIGSPAAFLVGLIFEQCFLFVPMSILIGLGIAAIRSRRN